MEYIKGNGGNIFLIIITVVLLIIWGYSEYKHQSWNRPRWTVIGETDKRHIYIKECTSYIRDDMYLKSGILYEEQDGKLRNKKKYFITPKNSSITLLDGGRYKFPFQLDIYWTSIEECQAWYTPIVLPKEYKGIGKTYKILLDFRKEGIINLYLEDKKSQKLIGTYSSKPQEWEDLIYPTENMDKGTQATYLCSTYKWKLEIDLDNSEFKTNNSTIYFNCDYPYININIKTNKEKPKVMDALPEAISIDKFHKTIWPGKIELLKSLQMINETEPGSVSQLKLTIFSPDSVEMNLISESGVINYSIPRK